MSNWSDLSSLLARLQGVEVGCVGDVMLDRFVSGVVQRISPEAPVPVLRVDGETVMPGGAGNVAANLASLGARPRLAGVVGDDAAGRTVAEHLQALIGAEGVTLAIEAGRPTTTKTRFIAQGQHLLRADAESTAPVSPATEARLANATAGWDRCPMLILSDYGKGTLAGTFAARLIEQAHERGARVLIDPKGHDYARYAGADVVTPNRRELSEAVGTSVVEGGEVAAARALIARHRFAAVVVTLGRDGMLVVPAEGEARALPAEAREVFDVSGAGDTVAATLAAALAANASLPEAAALANAAAGLVVGKVGTAVARADELSDTLDRQERWQAERKLLRRDAACERRAAWARQGLRVGFTNGCFDLLHPGHVGLLQQARAACDRLVVGLNSDASVHRLKGEGRPVQTQAARATVLASLAPVDAVVVFDEDTPLALIEALRPDLLVKGADYRLDEVVGAHEVQSWGGRVLLAPLLPGFSTSATVARLSAPLPAGEAAGEPQAHSGRR